MLSTPTALPLCSTESMLKTFGTFLEVVPAGVIAGYLNLVVADIDKDDKWGNFAVRHTVPTYLASVAFALLGMLFKYEIKYQHAKLESLTLTRKEYFSEHSAEMLKFAFGIFLVGGTAFSIFTACNELAQGLGFVPAAVIATAAGMLGFFAGNLLLPKNGQLPQSKLADIFGVFAGFSAGGYALKAIEATKAVGSVAFDYIVSPILPGITGAISALTANVTSQLLSSCTGYGRFWTKAADAEQQPLLVDQTPTPSPMN